VHITADKLVDALSDRGYRITNARRAVCQVIAAAHDEHLTAADIYASTSDLGVKKQILNSFMVSGERDRLLAIAKSDPTPELRMGAIRYLGNLGANSQLASLYASESSVEIRSRIQIGRAHV